MTWTFAQAEAFARRVQIRRELLHASTSSAHPCTTMDTDDPGDAATSRGPEKEGEFPLMDDSNVFVNPATASDGA